MIIFSIFSVNGLFVVEGLGIIKNRIMCVLFLSPQVLQISFSL